MNTEKSKLLWIAVISLLILNFGTLAFILFQKRPMPPREHQGNDVSGFLIHELELNADQVKGFDSLKTRHHEQVEEIQHALHDMHKDFFNLMKTDVVDSSKVKTLAREMSSKQEEIELVTFNHFEAVRKICNEAQKKKFDDVIDEAMRMMAPKAPRPPGHPHRPH